MQQRNGNVIFRLLGLVRPLLPVMVAAVLMGVLGFACATAIPVLGALGIGGFLELSLPFSAGIFFLIAAFCAVSRGILRYTEQMCNHYIAFKLLALIREKVFAALRRLCPAKLDGHDKGNLISLITGDIELLEVFYAHTISPVAIAAVMTVISSVFIGFCHPLLGLLALCGYLVVGVALPLRAAQKSRGQSERLRENLGQMNSYVLDSLRGLSESIQYGDTDARLAAMERRSDELAGEEEAIKMAAAGNTAFTGTVISLFTALMLAAGLLLCQGGFCGPAAVLVSTIAMASSFGPVVALSNLGTGLGQTMACARRVLAILDEAPVVEEVAGREEIAFTGAACEQVGFAYAEEPVLENVSLEIPPNTVVGLVGKSGSGKSTLLKLLMRFWDAGSGRVSLSGRAIDEINTANLREMESYVTQDTWLFHDTIENNVRVAKPDATREEVEAACRKAAIHDYIASLPAGYDTELSELGDNLSGGERQRIGLARAFLHGAPLLLLDEPTSSLDSLNEAVILRSLERERQQRTVVLVSHRASTMKVAHKVYSVERGRVS